MLLRRSPWLRAFSWQPQRLPSHSRSCPVRQDALSQSTMFWSPRHGRTVLTAGRVCVVCNTAMSIHNIWTYNTQTATFPCSLQSSSYLAEAINNCQTRLPTIPQFYSNNLLINKTIILSNSMKSASTCTIEQFDCIVYTSRLIGTICAFN